MKALAERYNFNVKSVRKLKQFTTCFGSAYPGVSLPAFSVPGALSA